MTDASSEPAFRCAWCSATAAEGSTTCSTCGAALAQRETIGDLVIPGVTHVHPGLEQYSRDPLRIAGASSSQSVAGSVVGMAAAGGVPGALVALAGLGAVAATEYLGASRSRQTTAADVQKVGEPSEAVVKMLQQLKDQERAAGLSSVEREPERPAEPGLTG